MLLFLLLFLNTFFSHAQDDCWQNEFHPVHHTPYSSKVMWEQSLRQWQTQKPATPLISELLKAHKTYKNEVSTAQKMGNDKRKHCYIGCRIAQETSVDVAIYVGWMKEQEDLQDCDKATLFEPLDMQATTEGAQRSSTLAGKDSCFHYCKTTYTIPKHSTALIF